MVDESRSTMSKKKVKQEARAQKPPTIPIFARKLKPIDVINFEKSRRNHSCLYKMIKNQIPVDHLGPEKIKLQLAYSCRNIEQQFITLRKLVCMNQSDFEQRRCVTQGILNCLLRHHEVIYEGLIFGSSVNGLGFKDSDVDLRLRPLGEADAGILEPIDYARAIVEDTLKNIAHQTTRCSPASGCFAPSARCPVAKLKFVTGDIHGLTTLQEGMNFDISMLSTNSLGSFNSKYLRFLCHMEPKFHLLAIALRYWSKMQTLIQPGHLSSYALITMLIFFCQNTTPPVLPTVNQMSDAYFRDVSPEQIENPYRAMIRQEWNCLISLKKESYRPSENTEPLCLLLLKFFEFYLSFPYSSEKIISTRIGKPVDYGSFKTSSIYDEKFPMKPILNIQDPFDLKHNVTSGMSPEFFIKFISAIRISYERLFTQVGIFKRPRELERPKNGDLENAAPGKKAIKMNRQLEDWGLNAIFVKVPKKP